MNGGYPSAQAVSGGISRATDARDVGGERVEENLRVAGLCSAVLDLHPIHLWTPLEERNDS